MDLLDEFWKILLAHFEKTNSDFTIKHWIMPAKLLKFDQNYLYIQVPSQTYANFWEDNLLTDVMERGYDYFRKSFEPKFIISDEQDFSKNKHSQSLPHKFLQMKKLKKLIKIFI